MSSANSLEWLLNPNYNRYPHATRAKTTIFKVQSKYFTAEDGRKAVLVPDQTQAETDWNTAKTKEEARLAAEGGSSAGQ